MNRITGEMMDPVDGATQEIQGWANWRPLEVLLKDLRDRLQTLEQREPLQESSPTTASRTTAAPLAAPALDPTVLAALKSLRSDLADIWNGRAEHRLGSVEWRGAFVSLDRIRALDAAIATLTSPRPASSPSAEDSGPAMSQSSRSPDAGGTEGEGWKCCCASIGHTYQRRGDGSCKLCPLHGAGEWLKVTPIPPPTEEPAMQLHDFDPPLEAQSPSAHSLLGQSPFSDEMHPTGRDGTCPECYSKGYDDALEHDFNPPSVSGEVRQCDHPSHSRFHFSEQNRNGLSWWCIDCGALALGDYQKKVRTVGPTMQEHLG